MPPSSARGFHPCWKECKRPTTEEPLHPGFPAASSGPDAVSSPLEFDLHSSPHEVRLEPARVTLTAAGQPIAVSRLVLISRRRSMTHPREPDPLRPMLKAAESQLAERLEEACSHERDESTAELVRLEEALSDAARAAKQAVSLRRRISTGHGTAGRPDDQPAPASADDRASSGA